MILYDSRTAIHAWDGTRMDLAAEYRRSPRGPFSLELQRILDRMRMTPMKGRYALVILEPFRRWGLVRLAGERGVAPSPVEGVEFASMAEAEWDIFKRRWKELTGVPVSVGDGGE